MALGLALRVFQVRLRDGAARGIGQDFELNGPQALVAMAGARCRFEIFAEILQAGRDRFAASLMDEASS